VAKWIAESIFTLLFIAVGVVFWVAASPLLERSTQTIIGPAHFPRALSVFLVLFAVFNLFNAICQRAKNCGKIVLNVRVFAGAALFALYIYIIPIFGYFYVTPIFAICIMFLMEYRKPLQILLLSGGFTLVAYIVFFRLMAVRLPV